MIHSQKMGSTAMVLQSMVLPNKIRKPILAHVMSSHQLALDNKTKK